MCKEISTACFNLMAVVTVVVVPGLMMVMMWLFCTAIQQSALDDAAEVLLDEASQRKDPRRYDNVRYRQNTVKETMSSCC